MDDQCPNEPEVYNGRSDEDGCPDENIVVPGDGEIYVLRQIRFERDSAIIRRSSYPILDAVAATLNGNPQIALVEIQGHADERASDEYNIRLTRDRARAVFNYLVDRRRVDARRLNWVGYGERCPVDPGHNEEAWEQNRRVEFKIIRNVDGPTGVRIACEAGRELIPDYSE